jgi:exodeoxyribonuclease VII small subunit
MAKTPSIEDHFANIDEAVAALEGGELPLEEALARYESGLKAVRQAKTLLERYAARLEELRAEPERPTAE